MALCTKCGSIWNDEDLIEKPDLHWCDPLDVPVKGQEKIAGKTYDSKTGEEIL